MKRDYVELLQSTDSIRRLIKQVEESGGLKCPNCDDVGYTVECEIIPGYDNEPDVDQVQVQCRFCWTVPDSIFMRRGGDAVTSS